MFFAPAGKKADPAQMYSRVNDDPGLTLTDLARVPERSKPSLKMAEANLRGDVEKEKFEVIEWTNPSTWRRGPQNKPQRAIVKQRQPLSVDDVRVVKEGEDLGRKWSIQKRPSESTQNFRRPGFSPCPIRSCLLVCE